MEAAPIINFGCAPGNLPSKVLEDIKTDIFNYNNKGINILELNHYNKQFNELNQETQSLLGEVINIPTYYKILFMAGGSEEQFAAIPLNLIGMTGTADYLVTGTSSRLAAEEAKKYGDVNVVFDTKGDSVPKIDKWKLNSKASYVYYCDDDSIEGVKFPLVPETGKVPLVADMTSSLFTKRIDVTKFGLIFAALDKSLVPNGLSVVIVHNNLLKKAKANCPSVWNYTVISQPDSIYYKPPAISLYIFNKVLQWFKDSDYLEKMEAHCENISKLIYEWIDKSSGFYKTYSSPSQRSKTVACFRVGVPRGLDFLEEKFVEEAEKLKMIQMKGPDSVKGIRVGIFNDISASDFSKFVLFMKEFEATFRKKL